MRVLSDWISSPTCKLYVLIRLRAGAISKASARAADRHCSLGICAQFNCHVLQCGSEGILAQHLSISADIPLCDIPLLSVDL